MAVAVDEVPGLRKQKKRYKNSVLPPTVLVPCVAVVKARWPLDANVNAPRLDDPPNDDGVVKWGVSRQRSLWGLAKPAMGLPKLSGSINKRVPRKYPINAGVIIFQANGNLMEGNRLIVPLCENYKRPKVCPPSDRSSSCTVVHDDENDAENNKGVFSHFSSPRLLLQPSS